MPENFRLERIGADDERRQRMLHGGGGDLGRLQALAQRENVTLFMLLMSAFQALMHRCTGQEDVLVGSPVSGRTRVETERVAGLFLNNLVFRANFSSELTFRELLRRTRDAALGAYARQDLPFEKLVDSLHLQRDLSRSPLFQVMFVLQNTPLQPLKLECSEFITRGDFDRVETRRVGLEVEQRHGSDRRYFARATVRNPPYDS